MKVSELVERLLEVEKHSTDGMNAEVMIFDCDAKRWLPVTGFTYGGPKLKLYSDEP